LVAASAAAEDVQQRLPIIDVHVHALPASTDFQSPMCPWFLSDMPGSGPGQEPPPFIKLDCARPLQPAISDEEFQKKVLEAAERLNVTMVVSGNEDIIRSWHEASPDRVVPSLGLFDTKVMSVGEFRESLAGGFFQVMGEIAPQYQGMSPSDMSLDEYFAVAEELGIPVGIHMGTGGNGMANITQPGYRASMGRPFLLEDLLARHPDLKIWVMHAGYPMIDEMIALMGANAYVYVDLAGFIWSYPLDEIHMYLERLVRAGFAKRILYGTDLILWPELLETSIGVIENANYLSAEQKRDIFFNNAIRFFNWDPADFE
jgi:predicted TIM-barrel fold metal-dependent hydrolase